MYTRIMCPGCGEVMRWNLNAHPHASAYWFASTRVHLHMHHVLPNGIPLIAFLPVMVVPGISCRQTRRRLLHRRARAICSHLCKTLPCCHLRTQRRKRRTGTPKDNMIIALSNCCRRIEPKAQAHKTQRASYTHRALTHGNQKQYFHEA